MPSGSTGPGTGTFGQQRKLAFGSTFRGDSFGVGFLHILGKVRALDCIVVNIKTHGDSKCSFNLPLFGVDDNTTNKHSLFPKDNRAPPKGLPLSFGNLAYFKHKQNNKIYITKASNRYNKIDS